MRTEDSMAKASLVELPDRCGNLGRADLKIAGHFLNRGTFIQFQ